MDTKQFRSLVDELLAVIGKIVDVKAFPFLPVIYSSLFYFVEKGAAYRKAVLERPVGPATRRVTSKPQAFVDDFLKGNAAFALSEQDPSRRRWIFARLYPMIGLRDPFVSALFRVELDSGDLRKIVDDYDSRVAAAMAAIPFPRNEPRFWEALDSFVQTASGLTIDLARESKVQDLILARIRHFLMLDGKKK